MQAGQKVWVISTCLTQGIREAEVLEHYPHSIVVWVAASAEWPAFHTALGMADYRLTREEAVVRAEEMRLQKIKWLKNQLDKLEAMSFK